MKCFNTVPTAKSDYGELRALCSCGGKNGPSKPGIPGKMGKSSGIVGNGGSPGKQAIRITFCANIASAEMLLGAAAALILVIRVDNNRELLG